MAINIAGSLVTLRAVEPEDVDIMYMWENDMQNWHVSSTRRPYSRHMLSLFVEMQQGGDISQGGELRLMVCRKADGVVMGSVDLFDIDLFNHRAGVGVLIASEFRGCGYAKDALHEVESYVINVLGLRMLWCNVESDNVASMSLFERSGYSVIGVKKGWNWSVDGYQDEVMMQKIVNL